MSRKLKQRQMFPPLRPRLSYKNRLPARGRSSRYFSIFLFLIRKFSFGQTWMVSESVQTNGLISPNYHSSLKRAQSARAGYQVQVYDLDAPIERNSHNSQPRRNCPSVDQQVNYSSNSVKLDYDNIEGRQPKLR